MRLFQYAFHFCDIMQFHWLQSINKIEWWIVRRNCIYFYIKVFLWFDNKRRKHVTSFNWTLPYFCHFFTLRVYYDISFLNILLSIYMSSASMKERLVWLHIVYSLGNRLCMYLIYFKSFNPIETLTYISKYFLKSHRPRCKQQKLSFLDRKRNAWKFVIWIWLTYKIGDYCLYVIKLLHLLYLI